MFCFFSEKIGNNYAMMKKLLKFSFSLFKVVKVNMGK